MPINNCQTFGIDPKRKVLYRNFHDIKHTKHGLDISKRRKRLMAMQQQPLDYKTYLIEISMSNDRKQVFMILFPNYEDPNTYIKEQLPNKVFGKLLGDNEGLFSNFIFNNIEIRFGRMWISGYHGLSKDPRYTRTIEHMITTQINDLNCTPQTIQTLQQKEANSVVDEKASAANDTDEKLLP